ncbi:S8/S53 family peptidase [Aureispira anguillae]|uniref:S8 family peptidase n=1 Tax=Aureispira anguillae TaxID=2864201 RepID=A0A915YHR0_9BACT|nr:S8/S53 family peptidase [Aureispira anguillae]BDS13394.1 S8 family peptidase [Aureispira anguillae]
MYKLLCLFIICTFPYLILAQHVRTNTPEELIVMLNPGVEMETILSDIPQRSTAFQYKKRLSKSLNIHLIVSNDLASISPQLSQHPAVRAIQKNQVIQWRNQPNDLYYDSQWALDSINAPEAWNYTTGGLSPNGDSIVCAVVDGSFDVNHEDLKDNLWHNHAEIPNNQIDDDQNGFVDDYTGWQVVFNTDRHDYGSISNHGTSVLGIIGAKGNNSSGTTGINWDIRLMLISAHTANEITKISNVIESYSYILDMRRKYNQSNGQAGAFVVSTNSSWGIDFAWAEDHPIWCALYDSMGAVGILSVAATTNTDNDIDRYGDMPCSCGSEYLLGVSESSREDRQVAGYGYQSIDLFAPAESKSTRWSNKYGDFGGTSGAAPHVAGAIALLYSYPNSDWASMIRQSPQKAASLVKSILLNSVDKKETFKKSVSGGRLNLGRAMQQLAEYFERPEQGQLLNLYPSPTSRLLTIKAALANEGRHPVRVYNSIGQPVAIWELENSSPTIRYWHFDVSHLARGMYTVELDTGSKKYSQKFIKY